MCDCRLSTEAAGYYADHWIALVDAQRLTKLRARSVVIASGAMEQPAVFHNNDLPGVMLASAAQRLIRRFAVKPFDRAVVLAGNSDAYQAALDLHNAGVEVAAIVDLREKPDATPAAQKLAAAKIRIYQHHTVYNARAGKGKTSIVGATICPLDPQGQPMVDRSIDVPCDGIAMSVGWMPCDALINQAGGKMAYSDRVEQFVPETLPSGIFAAGRVNGIYVLEDQFGDGRRAGLMAAAHVGRFNGVLPPAIEHQGEPPSHPFPIFPHPQGKDFVDFDEDVQFNDIKNAVQEGFDSIELIKRYTTLGMGPSQGKVASMNGVRILAKILGKSIATDRYDDLAAVLSPSIVRPPGWQRFPPASADCHARAPPAVRCGFHAGGCVAATGVLRVARSLPRGVDSGRSAECTPARRHDRCWYARQDRSQRPRRGGISRTHVHGPIRQHEARYDSVPAHVRREWRDRGRWRRSPTERRPLLRHRHDHGCGCCLSRDAA